MVQRIEILLSRQALEPRNGLRWLVGTSDTPFTIVSILHCVRHSAGGEPDITAEADDIRVLLPRGLEIVGATLDGSDGLESAKKAGNFALQLASKLGCSKPSGVIAACFKPESSELQFYIYKGNSAEGIETLKDIFYHENPGSKLWKDRHLLRCKIQLQVPIYAKSFSDLTGYKAQLSSAFESILHELQIENIHCLIEGFSDESNKSKQALVKINSNGESINFADFISSEFITSPHGSEVPVPVTVSFMLCQSDKSSKVKAPIVEFLPVSGAEARVLDLSLDVVCVARHEIGLSDAIKSLVLPAISDQLQAMRQTVLHEFLEHTKLRSYHFCPPGFIHPVSCIYDVSYGESELKTVEHRRVLHCRLGLPLDRPLLRIATALSFEETKNTPDTKLQGRSRLSNVHLNLPSGSGVVGGHVSIIQGSYDYYHYLQDNINDNGWGCAYRSLQTIISWFRSQHYTTVDVPTHKKIQEILVEIGDKEASFIGSQKWIGAIELSFVLDQLLGVSCKVINVRSGAELPEKCRELALHFETQGTPIMIGGGVLAYTLLGVDYNDATGDCAFLILDPHYTGGEDLKTIWNGGWCGWKKAVSAGGEEFFLRSEFYNLLLPQRPNTI